MAETDVKPELDTESQCGVRDKAGTSHLTQGERPEGEDVPPALDTGSQTGS